MRAALVIAGLSLLYGCGYSDEQLASAYREGHRAGIIWCKREDPAVSPEMDDLLLVEWRRGFEESAGIQCASKARQLSWPQQKV